MNIIERIKQRFQDDNIRMVSVNGVSYYSATDIDNLLNAVEEEEKGGA